MEKQEKWSVWIDEKNKVVSTKEIPNSRKIYFDSKDIGINAISKLVFRGFKIG